MAEITRLGEGRGYVIRIGGRLIILQMAIHTSRAGEIVVVVDMAIGALPRRHGVAGGQREAHRAVIELGVQPVVSSVAPIAGGGEICRDVVGASSRLEIGHMAGRAGRRHRLEVTGGCALVARIAVHDCVRSGQRKTVIMLLNLTD